MKVVTQQLGRGLIEIAEAPTPSAARGHVTVQSRCSVISAGTEGMLLEFGRAGFVEKIRSQPERAKQVLDKIGTDGLIPTIAAVRDKLGDTLSPGYCQAGVVIESGDSASPFADGDRVVTNGSHAEVVRVPYNLTAGIPDGVGFEAAAFTPLAAIALQGLRLARPTLGESVVVFGLGLVGQLTVQIVLAHGCRCIGIDIDPERVELARRFGAVGLVAGRGPLVDRVRSLTDGAGCDAVLMTLATDSDEPMHEAAQMCRQRGRIVLVGVTGLQLRRADFYEKELSFQVSCSYGPGRYDPAYEQQGRDYPRGFVRWTEKRNFEAVLDLMAAGRLDTTALVTHRFPLDAAASAYDTMLSGEGTLGVVLTYPDTRDRTPATERTVSLPGAAIGEPGQAIAGLLGAGSFARRTLIPAIQSAGIRIRTVVSSGGVSAAVEGKRAEAAFASSDVETVLADPEIDTVFVLTRHDSHAALTAEALRSGKHVFVEKPLALSMEELEAVEAAAAGSDRLLMVGFNRRFAPLATRLKSLVQDRAGPLSLILTVNPGQIDSRHWTQDARAGGGRIVGEACHFIDLARWLTGEAISRLDVQTAADRAGRPLEDVAHLTIGFEGGSTAVVHYLATGSSRFPKERVEAFFDGNTASIDNWRRLKRWGVSDGLPRPAGRMDKGHEAELAAFAAAIRSGTSSPIPLTELIEVSRWSIRAAALAREGRAPSG